MIESAPEERALEAVLRPKVLEEFVGQDKVVKQISLVIKAAKLGGRTADHILLAGPPGLGKTTLAMIVAHEAERTLKLTSIPLLVVAPIRVNGSISREIEAAPGPFPTITSTRKSSIARYNISSALRDIRWISSMNRTSPASRAESIDARSPDD